MILFQISFSFSFFLEKVRHQIQASQKEAVLCFDYAVVSTVAGSCYMKLRD